jgi:cytochrome c-type biogenesis protein CcmH
MTLLVILALMTAAALGAVIWPLAGARRLGEAASDLAVYRDQLEEIERDRADERIGIEEFEAARVEVSRRLLAAANAAGRNTPDPGNPGNPGSPGNQRRKFALIAAVLVIPMLAGPLYAELGSPDLAGQPLGDRARGEDANSIAGLIARIEAHLGENPDDGRGWEIVAPVYMRLDRYDDAVTARRNALRLLGETPTRDVDLGEALTAAANGVITVEAKQAFERAAAVDDGQFKALFYLGMAAEQDGQAPEAARRWRALLDKAPADAPWVGVVRQALARVENGAVPGGPGALGAPGPRPEDVAAASNLTPEQRDQMIRGMVEQLATRLHQDGSDVDGWLRLLRAYMVLGDGDKAKAAAAEARGALAREPAKLRLLDEGIKGLGVVQQSLAGVENGAVPAARGPRPEDVAAASALSPDQRNQMIQGMVDQLATRLHQDGSDVDGWLRLLRAYMVLGDRDKAKAAVAEARGALAREPAKLRLLDEGIKGLGVGG